jgi:hypothetical protein
VAKLLAHVDKGDDMVELLAHVDEADDGGDVAELLAHVDEVDDVAVVEADAAVCVLQAAGLLEILLVKKHSWE